MAAATVALLFLILASNTLRGSSFVASILLFSDTAAGKRGVTTGSLHEVTCTEFLIPSLFRAPFLSIEIRGGLNLASSTVSRPTGSGSCNSLSGSPIVTAVLFSMVFRLLLTVLVLLSKELLVSRLPIREEMGDFLTIIAFLGQLAAI